jgi:ribosomal protein S18 acetylase RimI-like enzyme
MELTYTPIIQLDGQERTVLRRLLATSFPEAEPDLLDVEVERARNPRIGRGFAAVSAGQVVGAVTSRAPRDGRLFVVYLTVAKRHRRKGLAGVLLDELVRSSGADRVELLVDEDNNPAQQFYRRAGLSPAGGVSPAGQQRWSGRWRAPTLPSRSPVESRLL